MRRRPLPPVREEVSNAKTWRSLCENEWAIYMLVASVGALTYANSLNGEFVHDDIPAIVTNGDVNGGNNVFRVFENDFWGTAMSDQSSHKSYRPLTTLSFRLNYKLCGFSPWLWHACNVALHAVCCALVARTGAVVARLQRPFAALAALLFAVHPVHTEAASEPYPPFEDIFEAFDDSIACPQFQSNNIIGTIDCLHLNIHVPSSASPNNRLPVLVWIHGGAFKIGASGRSMHGTKFLVRHDVIVVLLNYRLGPYGFMCLDIPEVPSNQGLKDQLLALRWVRNNIEDFGGDVNKITVFGESAGGHSIDFHLISSQEKLYNNVIMQSGSSLAATVFVEPDKIAPIRIARYLGFETNDIYEAIAYISTVDTNIIIGVVSTFFNEFKPCVEKQFIGVNAFLTENWINADVPKAKNLPILIGFNDDEMIMNHVNQPLEYFENLDIFSSYLNKTFVFDNDYLNKMEKHVRDFYVGDGELNQDMERGIINFDSDYTYIHPIHRSIRKYVEADAGGGIFFYKFSYSGGRNFAKNSINVTSGGAAHADDLGYLFDSLTRSETPSAEDQVIIDRMTTMWTNFAKFSNPTPVTSELLPVTWKPVTRYNYNFLNINKTLSLGTKPLNHRMAFWDLFFKLNKESQRLFE